MPFFFSSLGVPFTKRRNHIMFGILRVPILEQKKIYSYDIKRSTKLCYLKDGTRAKCKHKHTENAPVQMDSVKNVGDEMSTLPYHYNWFLITMFALFLFGISNGSDASTLFTFVYLRMRAENCLLFHNGKHSWIETQCAMLFSTLFKRIQLC